MYHRCCAEQETKYGKLKRIEFDTIDGVKLRGDFFAARGAKSPVIVMTQGLTLLKEHYIDDSARRFQAAGISALVYDHRSYGSSDGLPRHETNPLQQRKTTMMP